jgi:preprotein translocase subunit SecG
METVVIIVHLIIVLALIGVVLLQRSEGGLGLGGGGGVSGFMTGRGQANALTRTTAVLAGLFFLTSLVLTIFASWGSAPRSIFEGVNPGPAAPAGQAAPEGQGPGVLEQLQRLQGEQPSAAPPAAPAAPTSPQVPQSQ